MNEQVSAWLTAIAGLPAVHSRLRRVLILNHETRDVIEQQNGPDTLFYCDPPYLKSTRASTGQYDHEMTSKRHWDLLQQLAGIKGKFMLSGYGSPMYDQWAVKHDFCRRDFELPNNAAGGKNKRRMIECIWMNF